MPTGIYERNKPNAGWFKKGMPPVAGFKKGHSTWNKGVKGMQPWHDISGLNKDGGKGRKRPTITGEKNYQWKGDKVSYRSLHRWVEKYLGKPLKCENCGKKKTTPRSIHWANKDHLYKRNLVDWMALCALCHRQYDDRNGIRKK